MSHTAPSDTSSTSSVTKHGNNINAGIDSSLAHDPTHRGSLTPSELDLIHQTHSFKHASQIEEEDNRELDAKKKQMQRATAQNK